MHTGDISGHENNLYFRMSHWTAFRPMKLLSEQSFFLVKVRMVLLKATTSAEFDITKAASPKFIKTVKELPGTFAMR